MLQPCFRKHYPPKPIKKVSEKQPGKIKENGNYYRQAIGRNLIKNKGVCKCDECGEPINNPTGRNVCHIVSGGANEALYLEPDNHFILGKGEVFGECNCGWKFDESGEQASMKIGAKAEQIRQRLTVKYYRA